MLVRMVEDLCGDGFNDVGKEWTMIVVVVMWVLSTGNNVGLLLVVMMIADGGLSLW